MIRLLLISLFLTGCASVSLDDFYSMTDEKLAEIIYTSSENACIEAKEERVLDGKLTEEQANSAMSECINNVFDEVVETYIVKNYTKVDDRWYFNTDLQKLDDQIDWGELLVEGVAFALEAEANYQQRARDAELRSLRAEVNALRKARKNQTMKDIWG